NSLLNSKLDLKSGFYQIPINHEDKEKTAFVTPFGHYQFNVLPMGLKNSPPTFQKVMTNILKSCRAFCRSESRSSSPLLPPVVCSSQVRRRDESRPYAHTTSSEELQDHRSRQSQHNTGMQRQSSSSRSHLWPPVASCSSVQRREDNRRPTNNNQSSSRDYRTHHNRNQTRQPIRHPHEHLLKRKPENCPDGLTESQRTSWLKAGKQALENHQLNAVTPAFQYDKKHYGSPISIDYLTEDKTLTELISKFKSIKEYMIDTESDSNIGQPSCPRKQPNKPAIIQIQAIESEETSTVIIIEAQFLPDPSSDKF
ncbi:unnamed protein product, partial [Didymodactylos carnosus]